MSDEELELRPVYINGEMVYVNRFGDLWRWKYNKFRKSNVKQEITGYIRIQICKNNIRQHRIMALAFLGLDINNKDIEVDHINGVRHDNRLENIRLVTHQQNQHNRTKALGCSWSKWHNKWKSQICVNGKDIYIGVFKTEEEAHKSYLEAKLIYHKI